MHALDITVTLGAHDAITFSAHALGVAARLAAWPGAICTSARTEPTTGTFSGCYLVHGRRRARFAIRREVERLLRSAPSVTGIRVIGRPPETVDDAPRFAGSATATARSSMFDTMPVLRGPRAA